MRHRPQNLGDVRNRASRLLHRIPDVTRRVHSGDLEAVRVGRSFRIPERALAMYMDETRVDVS
jgi:excisionase family DNA binding protein